MIKTVIRLLQRKPSKTCRSLTVMTNIMKRRVGLSQHCSLIAISIIIISLTISSFLINLSDQQSSISLNNAQWLLSNANKSILVPAQVPGGVYSDLRRNQILKQDILFGKNDIHFRWVGNENWTYTTSFAIDNQIARSQSVKLIFHGIDTISTVYLNGQLIGRTESMFVRYKFEIKPHLRLAGLENVLVIKFESPVKFSARRSHQSIRQNKGKIIPPYCPSAAQRGECHVNFIRKMQASFSWDWGPAFPSVGLYKDVSIEFGSFGLIRDILVETRRLPPLIQHQNHPRTTTPLPQVIISSNIRQQVKTPTINKTVPYIRAPPYYVAMTENNQHLVLEQTPPVVDITLPSEASLQLLEENWLLKTTLVAEMVQPSFGYNLRIEFNLNGVLHYESEHINVVANSDGFIRLGFNLRIDTARMRIKPWWPNNAGSQTLYKLTARMMPIPNPTGDQNRSSLLRRRRTIDLMNGEIPLQYRHSPHQTASIPASTILLTTPHDINTYQVQHISEKEISFGFRTVELIQEPVNPDNFEDGLTFNFKINGVDLFAMGSNWIPNNILPEYANDLENVRYLLQSAKDANMNMLRVWGGGLYETDQFYSMADEMGIMIWHDFMFACALYPADDDFLASVRLEIEQQVQRLQYHPSIVLWAGNNENEMAISGPWWPEVLAWSKKLKESYSTLYVDTIKPIVQILDPTRPYMESSPSNGILSKSQPYSIARIPNDNKYGDVHHYDYLADSFEWFNYPSTRFASEYGFQSYPSFNALRSISNLSDWKYPLTQNILHRQHRLTGESEIKLQIKMHFNELESGGIDKLKTFLYVSQLTQAIAIKTETEFYRRNRFIDPDTKLGKTMGALYWQLNDVWQAPTWSSIEYGGVWKMLHYFARRFFFPIQAIPYLIQQPIATSNYGQQMGQVNIKQQQLLQQQQQQQQQYVNSSSQQYQPQPTQSLFVVDLVRDDLFYLLDSFNVTIRFYRYTSFTPVWQDIVYVKHTRPQNITRIYEQDISRILRLPNMVSLTSGVFLVTIESQARFGLSQIENYLMPVAPARVTAMRKAKISVELVQGPFELTDVKADMDPSNADNPSAQWSCAYRLTLVSDSIAMFVWLDLDLMNLVDSTLPQDNLAGVFSPSSSALGGNISRPLPPDRIRLEVVPSHSAAALNPTTPRPPNGPPEHIRLHINNPEGQRTNQNAAVSSREARKNFSSTNEPVITGKQHRHQHPSFRPMEGSGSAMLRYQFSDNAFNMFEPSKVVDLYLNRCLSRSQIESILEVQSLADCL